MNYYKLKLPQHLNKGFPIDLGLHEQTALPATSLQIAPAPQTLTASQG